MAGIAFDVQVAHGCRDRDTILRRDESRGQKTRKKQIPRRVAPPSTSAQGKRNDSGMCAKNASARQVCRCKGKGASSRRTQKNHPERDAQTDLLVARSLR